MNEIKDFFYDNYNINEFEVDSDNFLEYAMNIESKRRARAYLRFLTHKEIQKDPSNSYEFHMKKIKDRIGYFAGYYGIETRKRVEEYFDTQHPIFGRVDDVTEPTIEEAMTCGKLRAIGHDIDLKTLREKRQLLKMLRHELSEKKHSNVQAWETYGSELCAESMIEEENKILKQIDSLSIYDDTKKQYI